MKRGRGLGNMQPRKERKFDPVKFEGIEGINKDSMRDLWIEIFQHVDFSDVLADNLFLVSKITNQNFIRRYLESTKMSSRIFRLPKGLIDVTKMNEEEAKLMEKMDEEDNDDGENDAIEKEREVNEECDDEKGDRDDDDRDGEDDGHDGTDPIPKAAAAFADWRSKLLTEAAKGQLPSWIRRGDVAHFEDLGDYRNMGKMIWDGAKLIDLDYHSSDDYGIVPSCFKINEFPSTSYFVNTIDHNSDIWLDPSDFDIEHLNIPTSLFLPISMNNYTYEPPKVVSFKLTDKKNGRVLFALIPADGDADPDSDPPRFPRRDRLWTSCNITSPKICNEATQAGMNGHNVVAHPDLEME